MSVVLLLLIVAAVSDSAVIDSDSPSPARQRLVSSQAIVESDYSSEMYSQKRPMETIDDLMNALAQVTKSKGKYNYKIRHHTDNLRVSYRWHLLLSRRSTSSHMFENFMLSVRLVL